MGGKLQAPLIPLLSGLLWISVHGPRRGAVSAHDPPLAEPPVQLSLEPDVFRPAKWAGLQIGHVEHPGFVHTDRS